MTEPIALLRRHAETIRTAELARAEAKLAGLSPEQRRAVETATERIVTRLLRLPAVRLAEDSRYALELIHLFALEEAV
jgi:glutamyl-tRNA reductase